MKTSKASLIEAAQVMGIAAVGLYIVATLVPGSFLPIVLGSIVVVALYGACESW